MGLGSRSRSRSLSPRPSPSPSPSAGTGTITWGSLFFAVAYHRPISTLLSAVCFLFLYRLEKRGPPGTARQSVQSASCDGSFVEAQRLPQHDQRGDWRTASPPHKQPTAPSCIPLSLQYSHITSTPQTMKHTSQNPADMERSVFIPLCICVISFAVIAYSH
jgi:hypothetical protein